MHVVQEQEFLHIHRQGYFDDVWQIGSKIDVCDRLNPFLEFFNTQQYFLADSPHSSIDALQFIKHTIAVARQQELPNPLLRDVCGYDSVQTLEYSCLLLKEYILFIREHIFEEVRQQNFPDYPSRYRCLWVLPDNRETLRYWKNKVVERDEQYQIFKLKLTGKIHCASQYYLKLRTYSFRQWRELAFRYWSGMNEGRPEEQEYLFEGCAYVQTAINYVDYMTGREAAGDQSGTGDS